MSSIKPRTVLYMTPSTRLLGARRSLLQLVTNLDRERWRPIVCGQSPGDLADAIEEQNIPFESVFTGWWRKGKYFIWRPFAIARLRALARRVEADLVHCNEIYPNPYAVRACAAGSGGDEPRIPVVTHMRLNVTPRQVRNYDLIRADKIIVPSVMAGRDFDLWPDKDQRVVVIHNGVDLAQFRRTRSPAEARRQIGLTVEGVLLTAIGQLGPRKGGDVIMKAFKAIAAELPDVHLMFVGNPHRGQEEFADRIKREASAPELAGRVHFFPFTRRILPYYEAADINLLISRKEGFGRTIIEAGAVGVPSIGARVGGIPEVIDDGHTGLLIERKDDRGLAEALRELIQNPAKRIEFGESAFRHVAQVFSIRTHAERMMNLYDSVLEKD